MLKKPLLPIGAALILALSGCEARTPASSFNSSSGKDPIQQESENTDNTVPEKPQPESTSADTPMDDEFYKQVVLTYGADEVGENTGWFFPQEQFEPKVQAYFQVSTDRLLSDPEVYDAEHQGYSIDGAEMGAGARPLLEIQQVETDESRHKIHIRHYFQEELDVPGVFQGNSVLTILLHEDGTYQYESWQQEEERD